MPHQKIAQVAWKVTHLFSPWPEPEPTSEEKLRLMLQTGREIERQNALQNSTIYHHNHCQFCLAKLEPVSILGEILFGCPNRGDGKHNTGEVPAVVGPMSVPASPATIAANRMLREKGMEKEKKEAIAIMKATQYASIERKRLMQYWAGGRRPSLVIEEAKQPKVLPPPPPPPPKTPPLSVWDQLLSQKEEPTAKIASVKMMAMVHARIEHSKKRGD